MLIEDQRGTQDHALHSSRPCCRGESETTYPYVSFVGDQFVITACRPQPLPSSTPVHHQGVPSPQQMSGAPVCQQVVNRRPSGNPLRIETSADARQSRARDGAAGVRLLDGTAPARGFFASISQMWRAAVSGREDSPHLTADTVTGFGPRGSNIECVTPPAL